MHKDTVLLRDCPATEIPAGTPVVLPAGTAGIVTQMLGGSVTLRALGTLYRIAPEQVSALKGFAPPAPAAGAPVAPASFDEQAVWAVLKTCFDPEIPLNIVDLGLVYDLAVEAAADGRWNVAVKMTLTAPGCGMGPVIAEDARAKILALPGVAEATVHIVWDPAWTPEMMSTEGRQVLGLE